MNVSIVIRTLNEAEHLPALLAAIARQDYSAGAVEIVLVDSGSTDRTLEIAAEHGAKIVSGHGSHNGSNTLDAVLRASEGAISALAGFLEQTPHR